MRGFLNCQEEPHGVPDPQHCEEERQKAHLLFDFLHAFQCAIDLRDRRLSEL